MTLSVAIIGASHKVERYSNMAQVMLKDLKHSVFPVSGNGREILGVEGYRSVSEIEHPVDTVTLYLNADLHAVMKQDVLALKPRRIIFNPGTESNVLMQYYQQHGIEILEACTLVLLRTGQFE